MHVPGYLQKALSDCNPEVRAQLTLAIAKSANRTLFWYRLWTGLESGATCLFVLFTLSVLLFSSLNESTTAWFQSLKLFSAISTPQSAISKPQPAAVNPQGKKLELNDKVADYPITNGFGWRVHPVSGERSFHNGVDIGVPAGTKIVAPFDGEVEQVTNDRCGYGLRYYSPKLQRHRIGLCHLSVRVATGKIKAGEQLARSGGSPGAEGAGSSTGPHLHFALFNASGDPVPPTAEVVQKFLSSNAQ